MTTSEPTVDEARAAGRAPEVVPDPDWLPADPLNLEASGRRSFVSGGHAGDRLRVAYFRRAGRPGLVGRAWFGPGAEGPPGHAHGGSIAAVLDEAMGSSAWQDGYPVVAAKLVTDFRNMLPLSTDARFEARVERVEGRKVWAVGRLYGDDGTVFCEAQGLFILLPPERLDQLKRLYSASSPQA